MPVRTHTGECRRTFAQSRPAQLVRLLIEIGSADKLDVCWWFGLTRRQIDSVLYQARYFGHIPHGMKLKGCDGIVALEPVRECSGITLEDVKEWT